MLAAEAMRLAAIEVLCPTACRQSDQGWPTLARHRVYDSTEILPDEVDGDAPFTPAISCYTEDIDIERRGESAASGSGFPTAVLAIVVELAVAMETEDGEPQIMPLVENDASARLVLGALCAQVRYTLTQSEAGSLFRRIVSSVERVRIEPFSLPQFDIRWMRNTMRLTCRLREDKFSDEGGMPEPMKALFEALPAGSYAKTKLAELDQEFAAPQRNPLDAIWISTRGDPAEDPEASV